MTRHEILCKISHYEWMIQSMNLNPRHEAWIQSQLKNLTASLHDLRQEVTA